MLARVREQLLHEAAEDAAPAMRGHHPHPRTPAVGTVPPGQSARTRTTPRSRPDDRRRTPRRHDRGARSGARAPRSASSGTSANASSAAHHRGAQLVHRRFPNLDRHGRATRSFERRVIQHQPSLAVLGKAHGDDPRSAVPGDHALAERLVPNRVAGRGERPSAARFRAPASVTTTTWASAARARWRPAARRGSATAHALAAAPQ